MRESILRTCGSMTRASADFDCVHSIEFAVSQAMRPESVAVEVEIIASPLFDMFLIDIKANALNDST